MIDRYRSYFLTVYKINLQLQKKLKEFSLFLPCQQALSTRIWRCAVIILKMANSIWPLFYYDYEY